MAIELFMNTSASTLNGAINNSVTTLVVTDASKFPASGNFRLIIESEIVLVTDVSGTTFTIVRGIEGTAAASHADVVPITHVLTAGSFEQWLLDRGVLPIALGDRKPITPGAYDEEFEGTADTLPSGWSWDTTPSGSDSFTLNSRWPSILSLEGTGDTTYKLTKAFAPGSGNFGIWFKMFNSPILTTDKSDFRFYVKDASGNEGVGWEHYASGVSAANMRSLQINSGSESLLGGPVSLGGGVTSLYGGITRTSSNVWNLWYSNNGLGWMAHSGQTHTMTVGKLELSMGTTVIQSFSGLDWIRYRTDLNFPRIN